MPPANLPSISHVIPRLRNPPTPRLFDRIKELVQPSGHQSAAASSFLLPTPLPRSATRRTRPRLLSAEGVTGTQCRARPSERPKRLPHSPLCSFQLLASCEVPSFASNSEVPFRSKEETENLERNDGDRHHLFSRLLSHTNKLQRRPALLLLYSLPRSDRRQSIECLLVSLFFEQYPLLVHWARVSGVPRSVLEKGWTVVVFRQHKRLFSIRATARR
jgi:hypothetical protein